MPSPLVTKILESMNREVLNQLDLASAIGHSGENGRAREQIVAAYLRRVVPEEFGISTGFVFDAAGDISKQIDLVVYRRGYHPVFEIGGIKHFMVESVVAVIENKASIASRASLAEALANLRSVKALDRTNARKNYVVAGNQRGPAVDPAKYEDQVFGATVTEKSLQYETLKEGFFEFFGSNPDRAHWPNMYADVRGTSALYLKPEGATSRETHNPSEAEFFCLSGQDDADRVPPLLSLTFELVNFLRVASVVDYKPTAYFNGNGSGSGRHSWKLP